jgi:hypothetical protein
MLPTQERQPATTETTTGDNNDQKEERAFNRRALFTRLFKPDA